MEFDEPIVVGEDQHAAPPTNRMKPRVVVSVLAATTCVACLVWWLSRGPAPDDPEPVVLEAPSETVTTERTVATTRSDLGDDWVALPLHHDGYVTSITAGSGGWLAVSSGDGIQVHTSTDAVMWSSHPLPAPSGMVMAPTAVSGELLVVAGTDVVDSRGLSWISADAGESWRSVRVSDQQLALSSVTEVQGRVYAAGSILRPEAADGNVGTAAAWRLDGETWEPLSLSATAGPDSRVVAIVDSDGTPAAVGFDASGLAVWRIDEGQLIPAPVTGGDGARPTAITQSPDGRYATTGYAAGSTLVSDDLVHWRSRTSPTHWRITNVGDDQVGAGFDYLAVVSSGEETSRATVAMGLISDISASEDGVIVAAGATNDDYTGVLWIRGISRPPTVVPVLPD